jgi:hypothetical protein
VNQTRYAGVHGGDHRRAAHCVDVDLHANLLGLVHDCLHHFDLGLRRPGLGRQCDLARMLHALRGQRLNGRTRFRRGLPQIDLA